ncbi:hypothetical protein RZS08_64640, partial [Arthrospira platensis SPKY1]|nr:hypothetical protein [Arthrospira platensis SPKY1]
LTQLAFNGLRESPRQAGELHRELLIQQVGAKLAARAVEQAGLLGGLAHALDELAHEQRFELTRRLLQRSTPPIALTARTVAQGVERGRVGRQALGGRNEAA